jgi:hypothetical protein
MNRPALAAPKYEEIKASHGQPEKIGNFATDRQHTICNNLYQNCKYDTFSFVFFAYCDW